MKRILSEISDISRKVNLLSNSLASPTLNVVIGMPHGKENLVERFGRWAVNSSKYPFDKYPPYMTGSGYIISRHAALNTVLQSDTMNQFPVEDAFITGVLSHITGVDKIGVKDFSDISKEKCDFILDKTMIANGMTATDMYDLWTVMKKGKSSAKKSVMQP